MTCHYLNRSLQTKGPDFTNSNQWNYTSSSLKHLSLSHSLSLSEFSWATALPAKMRSKDKIAYYYDGTLLSLSLSHSPISYFSLSFIFLFKSFNSLIIKNQNPSCIRTRPISLSPCIYHLILYLDAIMMLNQNRTTISTIHLQIFNVKMSSFLLVAVHQKKKKIFDKYFS